MKISVLTIFPESFESFLATPVVKRAIDKGLAEIEIVDLREYAGGSFRHIDDSPYGGGPGMIMRCQPILDALAAARTQQSHAVMLSPKGRRYDQKCARRYAAMDHIILLCGHYEGIDARVESHFDEQLSLGDYILTGGELAAQVVIDSVVRLLKGALRETATTDESHENGLLEYPQYTHPAVYEGEAVPEVLLSGNHKAIEDWRRTQALLITRQNRPDLFEAYPLSNHDKELLKTADQKADQALE
ncbi:MAG: tRNA (guanosine(37)-N1)-methyltransferase TrmD [Oscillospiraceae bacterium]|nr:tRNA (guanosine(37)-N1)-methyltransferase TrmD [Oscillospiraceae bacterium]